MPAPPPVFQPQYATGVNLWLLPYLPHSVSPADPAFVQGQIGPVSYTGMGQGKIEISGGPSDTFNVILTFTGGSAFTWSLDGGQTVSLAQALPGPDAQWELPTTRLLLNFQGTWQQGDTASFQTVISQQVLELLQATSSRVARKLKIREGQPVQRWSLGLQQIVVRLAARDLLGGKGFDPKSPHDREVVAQAEMAWRDAQEIAEELQQGDDVETGHIDGIQARSLCPQAPGPW